MKEPMRCVRTNLVFERATIELWLKTRGQVCPITNEPLTLNDLSADDDLRNQIMRYHIQQTTRRIVPAEQKQNDDLYDF